MGLNPPLPVFGAGEEIPPGTVITGFSQVTPLNADTCRAQIAASISLGFPDAVSRRRLIVVANGPSARDVDLSALDDEHTLAVNGSLSLFLERGLAPTYWAACDPQAIVASFLPDDPPLETIYLVASKCHQSVFEKLKGRDVRVWHVNDYPTLGRACIPPSCAITITATWLMHRLGFTDFEYYGWDGCFIDGAHHASKDAGWNNPDVIELTYGGKIVDDQIVGGRTFKTTRAWIVEADGAPQFFNIAKYFDVGVVIHGDGMFKCAQEFNLSANSTESA